MSIFKDFKIEIDFTQASTKRGAIWLTAALIGIPMLFMGIDVSQLLLLAAAIAGGMGVAIKD